MTQINVTQHLVDLDGKPLVQPQQSCPTCGQTIEGVPLTLRLVCTASLVAPQANQELSGDESVKRYQLAMRIYNEDEPDLSLDERKLTRDLIAKRYGPLVVGQVWGMLE